MKAELMDQSGLVAELSRQCDMAGGQSAWAQKRGIPRSQVCEALNGRRAVSEAMANAMGFVQVAAYRRVRQIGESRA